MELLLGVGALLLLGRDAHRVWLDSLRRPGTLLMAGIITVLLAGTIGSRDPDPRWLVLPGLILAWEVGRGWRLAPRCHLWESGVGMFALSLLLAGIGLTLDTETLTTALLVAATGACLLGAILLWRSYRREPRAWRADDSNHYERRLNPRPTR